MSRGLKLKGKSGPWMAVVTVHGQPVHNRVAAAVIATEATGLEHKASQMEAVDEGNGAWHIYISKKIEKAMVKAGEWQWSGDAGQMTGCQVYIDPGEAR